jgi:hypothetical protein
MSQDVNAVRAYIEGVELPAVRTPAGTELEAPLPAIPEYQTGIPQVITIGSQIAEFAANVPADLRPDVANSFLLAQLAADRWVETHPSSEKTWYNAYLAVLKNCGWVVEGDESSLRTVSGTGAKVHQEIVGVLTLALGPAVGAASLILGVLNGLKAMEKDQPFFTIFDRASQRAEARLFQISYVAVGPDKSPRINLAAYNLEASASATQVLFFKLASSDARLRSFGSSLSINAPIFAAVRQAIFDKVKDRVIGNVTSIEI